MLGAKLPGATQAEQKSNKAGSGDASQESGESFAGQMEVQAAALAAATALPQANPQMPKGMAGSFGEAAQAMTAPAQPSMMLGEGKLATGSKTGAMIAGLQPRNAFQNALPLGREWVFDGADQNPNLKTLLASNSPTSAPGESVAGKNLKGELGAKASGITEFMNEEIQPEVVRGDLAERSLDARSLTATDSKLAQLDSLQSRVLQTQLEGVSQDRLAFQNNGQLGAKFGELADGGKLDSQSKAADSNEDAGMDLTSSLLTGLDHQVSADRVHMNHGAAGANSTLSGGEFLNMLNSVKGGAQAGGSSDGSQDSTQGNNQGGSGNKGMSSQVSGLKKKVSTAAEGDSSGLEKSTLATAGLAQGSRAVTSGADAVPKEMRAQVTQGGDTRDRMASDGLMSLSNNIRNMTPQGGGEIRVRLNPENLGELHVRVVTDGKQVGLQIQASDEKAKRILEGSMSDLRESLSRQHLNLGNIELTVGTSQQSSFADNSGSNSQSDRQSQFQNPGQSLGSMLNGGGNSNSQSGSQEGAQARDSWNASPLRTAVPGGRPSVGMSSTANAKASGRLDVRA